MIQRAVIFMLIFALSISPMSALGQSATTQTTFKIGDYIQYGTYQQKPVLWRVIELDRDGAPILFSEHILSLKALDPKGPKHVDPVRMKFGSNRYTKSALRQWLNSSDSIIDWSQNIPTAANMMERSQAYDKERGFLADGNFTASERELIKPYRHKIILHHSDRSAAAGGSVSLRFDPLINRVKQNYDSNAFHEFTTDRVFLLSVKQLHDFVFARGFDIRAKPTPTAVQTSQTKFPGLSDKNYWHYWLNTPNGQHPGSTRFLFFDGNVSKYFPYSEVVGVRPAIQLQEYAFMLADRGTGSLARPYILNRNRSMNTIRINGSRVLLNDKPIVIGNQMKPSRHKGQLMIPARAIFQAAGLSVSWNGKTNRMTAAKRGYSLEITANSAVAVVNATTRKNMPVTAVNVQGTLMLHTQFVGRELGYRVIVK